MEAKVESMAISEKSLSSLPNTVEGTEETILTYIQNKAKKCELNANAKEFVPRYTSENHPDNSDAGGTDQEPICTPRTLLNAKNGEDSSKPIFMNGMTEKCIEGAYTGNGREAEIPYMRYFTDGQALDFFNKKYFEKGSSGDIVFKPYGTNQQNQDSYTGPLYTNGYTDNIFKPPFINALVNDILYRQYLSAIWSKTSSPLFVPPRRGPGKSQYNSNPSGNYRPSARTDPAKWARNGKAIPKVSPQEEWLDDGTFLGSGQTSDNPPEDKLSNTCKTLQEARGHDSSRDTSNRPGANNDGVIYSTSLQVEKNTESPEKHTQLVENEEEKPKTNSCLMKDESEDQSAERQPSFLQNIAGRANAICDGNSCHSPSNSPRGDSKTFSDDSSHLRDYKEQDVLNPGLNNTIKDICFKNTHNTAHS